MVEYSLENETKMMEVETFLDTHMYLSGKGNPDEVDAKIVALLKEAPDRKKYPNLFAYWWNNTLFMESARALWGKEAAAPQKKKAEKKEEPKKKEAKKEEEDELDLFGDDDEEESKKILEEMKKKKEEAEKNKKAEKKKVVAKSTVTFDVKAYEETFDFAALAKKIKAEIQVDGLVWQQNFRIQPVAFEIKKLTCGMIIEDDKVSADEILEKIQDMWADDVQSCDIVEFNKV